MHVVIVQPQVETEARRKGTGIAIRSRRPLDLGYFADTLWSSKRCLLENIVLVGRTPIPNTPGLICPPLLPLDRIRTNGRAIDGTDNRLYSVANDNSQSRGQSGREERADSVRGLLPRSVRRTDRLKIGIVVMGGSLGTAFSIFLHGHGSHCRCRRTGLHLRGLRQPHLLPQGLFDVDAGTVPIAAPLEAPRLNVAAVAAAAGAGPVEEDVVAGVVRLAEAPVAEDAGRIGLARAAVPRNVPPAEDVAAGSGGDREGGHSAGAVVSSGRELGHVVRVEISKEGGKVDTVISRTSSTVAVAGTTSTAAGTAVVQDGTDIVAVIIGIVQICHNQGLGPLLHRLRIDPREGAEGRLGKDREGREQDGRLGLLLPVASTAIVRHHGPVAITCGIAATAGQGHLPQRGIALDGALDELGRLGRRLGRIPGLTQRVIVILDSSHRGGVCCCTMPTRTRTRTQC